MPIQTPEKLLQDVRFMLPTKGFEHLLSHEALTFLVMLQREFGKRIQDLLTARKHRQAEMDAGSLPGFLNETRNIRESDWEIAGTPKDLLDRRVEITGPVDRKMVINALNSGSSVYMADFEDATTPTWNNLLEGQVNLMEAVRRTLNYESPEGKSYSLNRSIATLIVRPRGLHLPEKHLLIDNRPIWGTLFDFGLYLFHNARELLARGTGPYFYLPKLESHLESRLWNDVFIFSQDYLDLKQGTIKATVLIETFAAAFEMDEILYEMRNHIVGLNCGRWDYIFSFIKLLRNKPEYVLPDRAQVTMATHFMNSYSQLLVRICHRRGAHAMGGMAAQIPVKNDTEANVLAMAKVEEDKLREVRNGHDGTWVAHPGLIPVAMDVFNKHMPSANQVSNKREDVRVTEEDLLRVPEGSITETGLRNNISVAIKYLEAWLGGQGCVPINNLMEDAATAEIARAQLWQWVRHPGGVLSDGRRITLKLIRSVITEELEKIREQVGESRFKKGHYNLAAKLLDEITSNNEFADFLTLVAYEYID
jgi:malate synthase